MDWFLYDKVFRHERVKVIGTIRIICSKLTINLEKSKKFFHIQQKTDLKNKVCCHFDVILAILKRRPSFCQRYIKWKSFVLFISTNFLLVKILEGIVLVSILPFIEWVQKNVFQLPHFLVFCPYKAYADHSKLFFLV